MKRIRLSEEHGRHVLVSDENFIFLKQFKWYCWGHYIKNSKGVLMHHFVVERMGLQRDGHRLVCDHINRDRFDNRRENLRVVTAKESMANIDKENDSRKKSLGQKKLWASKSKKERMARNKLMLEAKQRRSSTSS